MKLAPNSRRKKVITSALSRMFLANTPMVPIKRAERMAVLIPARSIN